MNRRQLLQRAGASLALPAVPAIAVAAPAGPTVTSLLADYRKARRRYDAAEALFQATKPNRPAGLDAEVDRLCCAYMDMEGTICATPPRDLREAIVLLRFVRENAVGDPYTPDEPMSQWKDCRDFTGIDNVLAFLEGMVQ